ncbi:MAG: Ycf48-like protein precursor [Bacteroidetes bacterium ADurb.Bin408]|nr:MAG: Ycf48-like protein precursor [Bacteroidetes bacterium ADurb.Bin408]
MGLKKVNLLIFNFVLFIACINISDAQNQWVEVFSAKRNNNRLHDIVFTDNLNGYIVGQGGIILKTTDGGNTWLNVESGTKETLFSVSFVDKKTGYACGMKGTVIKTEDSGLTWKKLTLPVSNYLRVICAVDKPRIYAFGEKGTGVLSNDNGKTWEIINKFTNSDITSVQFINNKTAYLGTYTISYKTVDGGKSWVKFSHPGMYKIFFLDTINGYAIETWSKIFKTTDGGKIWDTVYKRDKPYIDEYENIWVLNTNTVYVSNQTNGILKTNDGGLSWMYENLNKKYLISKVYFINDTCGFSLALFGDNIHVLKYTKKSMYGQP